MSDELNRKLLQFAGFSKGERIISGDWDESWPESYIIAPDGIEVVQHPNFTSSLDACFKWLVPKLREWGLLDLSLTFSYIKLAPPMGIDDEDLLGYQCRLHLEKLLLDPIHTEAETPALALCKAIEQLIDEQARESPEELERGQAAVTMEEAKRRLDKLGIKYSEEPPKEETEGGEG